MRAVTAILAVTVTAVGLAGCSPQTDTPPTATSSAVTTESVPTESIPADGLDDGLDIGTAAPPDETSNAAAVTVAENLMTAFARPNIDATAWINGLYPYLTQAAGTVYAGTDPAKVPVSEITGPGSVVEGATEFALLVTVPTNIGDYVVSLTRQAPADPWLADRVTPPTR